MGLFDRLFRRGREQSVVGRRLSSAPPVTAEQAQMNREVMEKQMQESREKRESDAPRG